MRAGAYGDSTRRVPSRALLLACLFFGVINALLIGGGAARSAASAGLAGTVSSLRANLNTLTSLRAERQTQVEASVSAARERLDAAEAALPSELERLDVFRLAYELAKDSQVLTLSLRRDESEIRETPLGLVEVSRYRIVAQADLDACLAYLTAFEELGLGVGLSSVLIQPEALECGFDVQTLTRGP